jgi:two-component system, LytTR family, sensor kinase
MSRTWIATQLAIAWLPMWALFTALMMSAHGYPLVPAVLGALPIIASAAALAWPVYRFTRRWPWPHPFRLAFLFGHVLAAAIYSVAWIALISLVESAVAGHLRLVIGPGLGPFLVTGMWLYGVVAGVSYANQAAVRAAELEVLTARTQLAALRSQLQPHFLFNALHTVVQLIPTDPRAAAQAAEQLAAALRDAMDEERDVITLAEEWAFVDRYLAIERIRLGERLVIETRIDADALEASLPSFALQTLVENAVRHGAGPRVEATRITIRASAAAGELSVSVADDGAGARGHDPGEAKGTGLRRLRDRMRALYGDRARLDVSAAPAGGFTASLAVPQAGLE